MIEVDEIEIGGTTWVGVRKRGAEWSWLTPQEAACLGAEWVAKYGTKLTSEHLALSMLPAQP
ncbi:MAG: hypothetical protein JO227_05680 [Acetobacteraceae bacterium]|nr:hypothetical protein [Acetobacteraceae bacterium]